MPKRFRDYLLPIVLLAASALLLLIVLGEWAYYRSRQSDFRARMAAKVEVHLPAQTVEQKRYELPSLDGYTATVERPLFMENRRPVLEDASLPETATAEKTPLNLKLKGIATSSDQAVGLFVDAKGKYKRVHKNESIDGWKLAEIEPGKATMEQNGEREELKLFQPKPKKKPQLAGPGVPPEGQIPGQIPGQPPGFPPQPVPVPGAIAPENIAPPVEPEQPNLEVPIDESAVPPEEPTYDQ